MYWLGSPDGSTLLIGEFEKGNDVEPEQKEADMNEGFELVFDYAHLKGDEYADNDGTAEHWQDVIGDFDDGVVEFFLYYANHVQAFLVEALFPEQV